MRACIVWDSQNIVGFVRYYPTQDPNVMRQDFYDFDIKMFQTGAFDGEFLLHIQGTGPGAQLPPRGVASKDFDAPPVPNVGGADNGQTYLNHLTAWTEWNGARSSNDVMLDSPPVTT
jgi:hypothetical protein